MTSNSPLPKRKPGRPKGQSKGNKNTDMAAVLERLAALEAQNAAKESENAQLRAQIQQQQEHGIDQDGRNNNNQNSVSNGSRANTGGHGRRVQTQRDNGDNDDDSEETVDMRGCRTQMTTQRDNNIDDSYADDDIDVDENNADDDIDVDENNADTQSNEEDEPQARNTVAHQRMIVPTIARPKGQAGKDYSIAVAMGLANTRKKQELYRNVRRSLHDLAMNSRIRWDIPWADTRTSDRAQLFAVAEKAHPFLAKYENSWATEVLVRQYFSNKRKTAYKRGTLQRPEKYDYLQENSTRRDPTASHKRKADKVYEASKQAKRRAKRA
ncbi:hypothetical protein K435DRAFT_875112 [Dendrothele bispora CBS 962.96]|uniref:Uncharacterized protein n=1 Tax=Dendrothele bispora (strain CBS 962.96) TaxID=1314807 RepID=A0A4S8KW45_DENBC|nr:hypothetical protein K435DRAFT_875112 [Dendrothele bispora CBS 962.96]